VIGLDTNVLVRYITQDDPAQAARATRLIESELSDTNPGFVGVVVLAETAWVLQRLYRVTRAEFHDAVGDLLAIRQLVVENRAAVARAHAMSAVANIEFADALVAECARAAGCRKVVSFDRGAARAGMDILR
jgi:predicted nucleic-acid-binding protein